MKRTAALLAASGLPTPANADGSKRYLAAEIDAKRLPLGKTSFMTAASADSVLYVDFHTLFDTSVLSESEAAVAAVTRSRTRPAPADPSSASTSSAEHAASSKRAAGPQSMRSSESRWWGPVNTCCPPGDVACAGSGAGAGAGRAATADTRSAFSGNSGEGKAGRPCHQQSNEGDCVSFGPLVVSHRSVSVCMPPSAPSPASAQAAGAHTDGKASPEGNYWQSVPELSSWDGPDWLLIHPRVPASPHAHAWSSAPRGSPAQDDVEGVAVDVADSLARVVRSVVSGSVLEGGESKYRASTQARNAEGTAAVPPAPVRQRPEANRTPGQHSRGDTVTINVPVTGQAARSGGEQPMPRRVSLSHSSASSRAPVGAGDEFQVQWYGIPGLLEIGRVPFRDLARPPSPASLLRSLAAWLRSVVSRGATGDSVNIPTQADDKAQGQEDTEEGESQYWERIGKEADGRELSYADVHRLYPLLRTAPVRVLSSSSAEEHEGDGEEEEEAGFAVFSRWAWDEARSILPAHVHVQHVDAHLGAHEAWVHVASGNASTGSTGGVDAGEEEGICRAGDYRLSWSEWRLPAAQMRLLVKGMHVRSGSSGDLITSDGLVRAEGAGQASGNESGQTGKVYLPVTHWWSEGWAKWFHEVGFMRMICTPDAGVSYSSCVGMPRTPSLHSMLSYLPETAAEDVSSSLPHLHSAGWGGHGPGQGRRVLHLLGWGGAPLLALFLCVIGAGAIQSVLHALHPGMRLALAPISSGSLGLKLTLTDLTNTASTAKRV